MSSAPILIESPKDATVRLDPAEWLAPLPLSAFQNLKRDLSLEYRLLRNLTENEEMITRQCSDKIFANLNRYRDIQPFETNRVLLGKHKGYINASHMAHMIGGSRFIASQGPLQHTIGDHWQMIWEQKTDAIFALGKLAEGPVEKCALYWPTSGSVEFTSRDGQVFVVTLLGTQLDLIGGELERREIRLSKKNDVQTVRNILHYHFTGWPDHQAVESSKLLQLVALVTEKRECTLVHCSAGVGRTGCVLTLASLISQIQNSNSLLSVLGTAMQLRQDRLYMMQTTSQYLSVYACLAILAKKY